MGPLFEGGCASFPVKLRGPSTAVSLHTNFFMACSGFTHGPPVSLQPAELKMVISTPSRSASDAACFTASSHSGVPKASFFSTVCPLPEETSARCMPPMPTRFIHSRSLVMPSLVTLPPVQCHQVRGLAESGGFWKPCSSGSPGACAHNRASSPDANAAKRMVLRVFFIEGPSAAPESTFLRQARDIHKSTFFHDRMQRPQHGGSDSPMYDPSRMLPDPSGPPLRAAVFQFNCDAGNPWHFRRLRVNTKTSFS